MYKIGELSKLCNISVKTLRYYDAEGLLIPDEIDKFTGYRYYSASKLEDCYRIIGLKELGFSLDEIRVQLTTNDNEKITAALNAKLVELQALIETTQTRLRTIESIKKHLTEGESKMFNIIVRATDEVRVAYVRKNYQSKNDAFDDIEKIKSNLPKAILGKRKIIINYEIEYREADFDLAACMEIVGKLPMSCEYEEKKISLGTNVASLICKEDELDDAYKAMIKHFDGSSYKVCGAYYEIYHDDKTVELKVPVCERTKKSLYVSDDIVPFADDPEVCGKWKLIDILPTREHFIYGKPKCNHLAWLDEINFIDGGKPYWAIKGWTKGRLFTYAPKPHSVYINRYTIEDNGKQKLLFLEMYDYCDGDFDNPEIWVYEQIEDKHYTSQEEFQRCDNIDYPFINDENVLGVWKVRDFLINREDFDVKKQNWPVDNLFVLSAEFKNSGEFVLTTKEATNGFTLAWTNGLVLNKHEKVASAYEIVTIDGKEYLFKEWKTGDYSFGGGRVYWYVFTRG